MITVYNKQELQEALKNKGQKIRVEGPYAEELAQTIQRKKKVTKAAMIGGGLVVIGGLLAAPFTGGASVAGSAAGAAAMGLTVGTVTLTTVELAMILGWSGYAIHKGCKVVIKKDGIEFDPK